MLLAGAARSPGDTVVLRRGDGTSLLTHTSPFLTPSGQQGGGDGEEGQWVGHSVLLTEEGGACRTCRQRGSLRQAEWPWLMKRARESCAAACWLPWTVPHGCVRHE